MDVTMKSLLLAFALALFTDDIRCPRVKTVIETIALRNCTDGPTLSNYFYNVNIVQERRDFNYVTADFIISDPGTNLKWKAIIYKCMQRDALIEQGGCEFFIKVERKDTCGDLKMKNELWSSIFNYTEPPFVCPFNKGVYQFRKIYFDVNQITSFASGIPFIQNYFWVSRAMFLKEGKRWGCIEYVYKIVTVKG